MIAALISWRALLVREYREHRVAFLYVPAGILVVLALASAASLAGSHTRLFLAAVAPDSLKLFEFGALLIFALWFAYLVVTLFFYFGDAFSADRRNNAMFFWKSMPVSDLKILSSKFLAGVTIFPALVFAVAVIAALAFLVVIEIGETMLGPAPGIPRPAAREPRPDRDLRLRQPHAVAALVRAVHGVGRRAFDRLRPLEPAACLRHSGPRLGHREHRVFRAGSARRLYLGLPRPALAVRARWRRFQSHTDDRRAVRRGNLHLGGVGADRLVEHGWRAGVCSRRHLARQRISPQAHRLIDTANTAFAPVELTAVFHPHRSAYMLRVPARSWR